MPNEQTSVPLFASGEVLTAANMNLSAGTGVPVFSNSTTRDAGFGGAGEKVLAEGQLCFLSDSNIVQYYSGASWATVGPASAGALTFIKSVTIGSGVTSVAVTGAFSTTYDTYKIVINGGVSSANVDAGCQLGATTTGYYSTRTGYTYAGSTFGNGSANGSSFVYASTANTNVLTGNFDLQNPFNADETLIFGSFINPTTSGAAGVMAGYLNNQTSYTDFTLTVLGGGNYTGGTIYVYGYAKA
jgi:hypothetical protein